ncbi:MAG TPA: lipocalin-like domain-containing protein [Bryobacteraceae bacterium]|nr:lipocalin-like domain-containing protein [Bryobacteraceae bacterium]
MRTIVLSLCILPLLAAGFSYREAVPAYKYQFPRDHFEHEDFRTEWWYYTGNVTTAGGERYGFELVFFREGERHPSGNQSAWAVQDLYLAHAALTDAHGNRFFYDERLNRQGPGVAGASFERGRIWNGNWSAQWKGDLQTLDATTDQFRFHLQLAPEKPFVIQGENGVSRKAKGPGRASHYVSFPRLGVSGTINSAPVSGTAWMDHEWFTEQLAPDEVGWDWFSIQLDDNTELMLYALRHTDGSIDPYSSGTFIDASGKARHLRREDFTLQPLSYWHKYPVAWRIRVPALKIDLTSHAILQDQELHAKEGGNTYWEGAVDYSGTQHGVGYIEMTGYEGRVRL